MTNKPKKITSVSDLHDFYWLKTDLMEFCKKYHLPLQGAKSDLMNRIAIFLTTGSKIKHVPIKKSAELKDSSKKITKSTFVKNYNNDTETRKFFVEQLGDNFKFNAYLRQFTNNENIKQGMTYGDLIDGWILFENNKKNPDIINIIPEQFEYNQFIKDYFRHEKNGTLKRAISAWKVVTSQSGPNTYDTYKQQKK